MPVFEDGNQTETTETTTQTEPTKTYLEQLVSARGDNWSNPEVIAKGKIEADRHIEELTKQLADMNANLTKDNRVTELLSKIEQKAAGPSSANAQNTDGAAESNTKTATSEETIQSLVELTLSKRDKDNTVKQNMALVEENLSTMFGTEAAATVEAKAKELGMSKARLQELASESPTAFFTLIGEKPPEATSFNKGSVRTESVALQSGNAGKKNNSYYQKLRKENSRLYNSAATQDQRMADRLKMGDSFYK